ncbi:uncharacterized protein LOC142981556 [Anticarsia gemmatalis]|uniref:uncharacterized protein LOC142981556 n=1 Tax=Anticarsia gemmatalis TaxID=129554 RepID=UPI003F75EF47
MESDEVDKAGAASTSTRDIDSQCAVNALILDYYKKFGRKRDLEQFFSLSTAQSDIKDTSGLFWRKMKSENDSSDSGGRRSDSSAKELCRISIRCSMPDSSQSDDPRTKTDSPQTESPPIITEEAPADISRQTDDESLKSDDNHSQKSFDPLLDLSAHKPLSPTSSVTSQRRLEWDSLADVGYGNESDRKTSASSLSTLERLALKQQYSNNDSKQDIGPPTCHSTPLEDSEAKSKMKKGGGRKMTRIIKKDVDLVEVNVPHTSDSNPPQSINVNLTKHISFNVEKDGAITFDNVRKDVNVSPEKVTTETAMTPHLGTDREIQTSLPKTKDKSISSIDEPKPIDLNSQKIPVMISLNTLRKRLRRKKSKVVKRRVRPKKKSNESKELPSQEKSGEQLSEAESFEYMPGHIYNQNQLKANSDNEPRAEHNNTAGNKSSLESSGGLTTDSSKGSKHSLTNDLEKCIEVLKVTLQKRYDDGEMKKKLIKEIVQRLLNSKYRDDESTTEFLSGLSFSSKKMDVKGNSTTSTSDANNTDDSKQKRPRKSILRMEKFDANVVASTSQSVPNLFTATDKDNKNTNLNKMVTSNTESDESSRGKTSSDNALPKTSSEELYMKYLEALKREESYKRHLRDKEMFLKQKLGGSENAIKIPVRQEAKINNRLKDLMKDLTRNNYDDGSGDASKLEGGPSSNIDLDRFVGVPRNQRSQSVFTLSSSCHSECQKKPNLKKKMQVDRDIEAGTSRNHYCCCPLHSPCNKVDYVDSSVQVNLKCGSIEKPAVDVPLKCAYCQECERTKKKGSNCPKCGKCPKKPDHDDDSPYFSSNEKSKRDKSPRNVARMIPDKTTGDIKYVCMCKEKPASSNNTGDFMIYKCCKLTNRGIQFEDVANVIDTQCGSSRKSSEDGIQLLRAPVKIDNTSCSSDKTSNARRCSQSSQTNLLIKMICTNSEGNPDGINLCGTSTKCLVAPEKRNNVIVIHEATRCLQTEISINPKIADPTLSDITIVNNCAQLICEQHREVDKSSSDNDRIKTFSDVYTNSESNKLMRSNNTNVCGVKSNETNFSGMIKDSDINIIESKNSNAVPDKPANDYTIPIQGTNMTLMVSLASTGPKKAKEQADQGVGTVKVPIADKNTCVAVECAKSAQCQSSVNSSKNNTVSDRSGRSSSGRSFMSGRSSPGRRSPSPKKSCLSKPTSTRSPQRNTYPKVVQVKDKKPLRRANTDTGNLENPCACSQTGTAEKGLGSPVPLASPRPVTPPAKRCGEPKTDTGTTMFSLGIPISSDKENNKKDIGTQKDLSEDESKKTKNSTRGCGVSCQTDTVEKEPKIDEKKACGKCGCVGECKCNKKVPTSEENSPRSDKCKFCGSGDACQCNKEPELKKICSNCNCEDCQCVKETGDNDLKDPIINMIQDITRRYSKRDIMKIKKKKCFTEIVTVLNYLLETDDSTDPDCCDSLPKDSARTKPPSCCDEKDKTPVSSDNAKSPRSKASGCEDSSPKRYERPKSPDCCDDKPKKYLRTSSKSPFSNKNKPIRKPSPSPNRDVKKPQRPTTQACGSKSKKSLRPSEADCCSKRDKGVQLSSKSNSKNCTESSDLPCSTDLPSTSDSAACKILNKIRKECEKYHLRRSKCGKKCEVSSSTSVNCEECKKVHHCGCRHKCKRSKTVDRLQKKCVAYNLILQTSESMMSEETVCDANRELKNVVVKVPKCKDKLCTETCKETVYKVEKGHRNRCQRSKSCPKESDWSSTDDFIRRAQQYTVREYLEKNRPDFVEKCSERQSCLKYINEMRANERAAHRNLLSVHVEREPDLTTLSTDELRRLAQQIGLDMRRKKTAPKFISEREMKKHSEKIYKTLPEVVQKKEDKKKENIKKTNLLMANIFKKNLQKKTLRGSVNLSNYSTVIKI